MLNDPAKLILSATSLAPVLGALFLDHLDHGTPWNGIHFLIIALFLFIICWLFLDKYASKELEIEPFYIKEFDRRDLEMLTFLLIYLLPFIQSDDPMFARGWFTNIYVVVIVTLAFVDVGAFQFNPMMRMIGYRFYIVKDQKGVSHLLISRQVLRSPGTEIPVVPISHDVYLHTEGKDA